MLESLPPQKKPQPSYSIKKEMYSMFDAVEAEIEIFSEEDAERFTYTPVVFPPYANDLFGEENLAELRRILEDPVLLDLNYLHLIGAVNSRESIEYGMVLPETQALFKRISELAGKMTKTMEPKIGRQLDKVIGSNGKINIRGIEKVLRAPQAATASAAETVPRGVMYHRMLLYFYDEMLRTLAPKVYELIKSKYGRGADRILDHYLSTKDPLSPLEGDVSHYAYILDKIRMFGSVINMHHESFAPIFHGEVPDEASLQRDFEEIQDLSLFRKIDIRTSREGVLLDIFPGILDQDTWLANITERPTSICMVKITGGNFFNVNLHRITGQLAAGCCDLSYFVGEQQTRVLKGILFKILLDYLRAKDEDITYAQSVPRVARVVHKEVRKALPEGDGEDEPPQKIAAHEDGEIQQTKIAEAPVGVETAPALTAGNGAVDTEFSAPMEGESSREPRPTVTMQHLRGIQGGRIKRALDALLGPPVRTPRGSHHIYQTRDGKTWPIALHYSEEVGVGLLSTALRHFGISPEELKDAL